MQQTPEPLENLIDQFARFPGIGRKGATRMAYEVMSMSNEQAMQLAKAIEAAKTGLHRCRLCQDYTAGEVCPICSSPSGTAPSSAWWNPRATSRPLSAHTNTTACTMCCTA